MNTASYLDRLLLKYSNTFDIYKPFRIGARQYPAYGYFFSHNERYILVREANMWSSDSYEHILFWEDEEITLKQVEEAQELIRNVLEPQLVRKGEALPEKNHMSSLITVVLLSQKPISSEASKKILKYRFDRGYQFNMRGYFRGRIIAASMDDRQVTASPDIKGSRKLYLDVFREVEEGKEGFTAVCERQGVSCFTQE